MKYWILAWKEWPCNKDNGIIFPNTLEQVYMYEKKSDLIEKFAKKGWTDDGKPWSIVEVDTEKEYA